MNDRFFINMPIPADRFEAVCAVLAGVSAAAISVPAGNGPGANAQRAIEPSSDGNGTDAQVSPAPAGTGETATSAASPSDGETDAHGHPWSAELHASTKGKTKDGLWRMKVGVTRPAPLPGFPVESGGQSEATGTSTETPTPSATSPTATGPENAPTDTSGDDDEFAAFREAASKSEATDAAAVAALPARTFTDADLGALCNQAAVKLGDPGPVKDIIGRYVPEGQVAHSRNIPEDKRAEFTAEVERAAGIEFAG